MDYLHPFGQDPVAVIPASAMRRSDERAMNGETPSGSGAIGTNLRDVPVNAAYYPYVGNQRENYGMQKLSAHSDQLSAYYRTAVDGSLDRIPSRTATADPHRDTAIWTTNDGRRLAPSRAGNQSTTDPYPDGDYYYSNRLCTLPFTGLDNSGYGHDRDHDLHTTTVGGTVPNIAAQTDLSTRTANNPSRLDGLSRAKKPRAGFYRSPRHHILRQPPNSTFTDWQFYRSNMAPVCCFTGPVKNPQPLYRKHSQFCMGDGPYVPQHGTNFSSASVSAYGCPTNLLPGPLGYAPYGKVCPSSDWSLSKWNSYGLGARLILKIAEIICCAIVIGCVAGVTAGGSFHSYVSRTKSEGQYFVLIISCVCLIMTFLFLVSISLYSRSQGWRNADGAFSGIAAVLFLIAGCVEAWYAACYPPLGISYASQCGISAWIAAAVFAFVAMLLYVTDFLLAYRTGIDVL